MARLARRPLLLAALLAAAFGQPRLRSSAASRLARLARPATSARLIGEAVLRRQPSWQSSAPIIEELASRHPQLARQPLAEHATRAVRDDFAQGRTVLVEGWLLSRCEAQLCALARLA